MLKEDSKNKLRHTFYRVQRWTVSFLLRNRWNESRVPRVIY